MSKSKNSDNQINAGDLLNIPLREVFWYTPLNYRRSGKTATHKKVATVSKKTGVARDITDTGYVYDDMARKVANGENPWHSTEVVPVIQISKIAKLMGTSVDSLRDEIRQNLADLGQVDDNRAKVWLDVDKINYLGVFGFCRSCTIADAIVDNSALDKVDQFTIPAIVRDYGSMIDLRNEQLRENEARDRGVQPTDMLDLLPVLFEFIDAGLPIVKESHISRLMSVSRGKRQQLWGHLLLTRLYPDMRDRLLATSTDGKYGPGCAIPANRILYGDLWHSKTGVLRDIVAAEALLSDAKTDEQRSAAKTAYDDAVAAGHDKVESFVRLLIGGEYKRSAPCSGKSAFLTLLKAVDKGSVAYELAQALLANRLATFVSSLDFFKEDYKATLALQEPKAAKTKAAPKAKPAGRWHKVPN